MGLSTLGTASCPQGLYRPPDVRNLTGVGMARHTAMVRAVSWLLCSRPGARRSAAHAPESTSRYVLKKL